VLLTRLPLPLRGVRLACVKPAASVRSEPGSNSQVETFNLAIYAGHAYFELTRTLIIYDLSHKRWYCQKRDAVIN
jgi:hypothetical protein